MPSPSPLSRAWRTAAVACAAVACVAAAGLAAAPVDPATLPWAVRALPGGGQMLLLDHSPVGVTVPAKMTCGLVTGGPPMVLDGHGQMYLLSATPLDGTTTRPASPPTLDELTASLKAVAVTPVAGSRSVAQAGAGAYQVRWLATNCHGGKVTVIDRGRVVGSQVVDCLVPVMVDFAPAVADAAIQSATLLGRAVVVQRRPVAGHAEAADAATPAVPHPAAPPPPAVSRPTPPVRQAVPPAATGRNARAMAALAVAQKLKEDGRDASAYEHFRSVVKQYPNTPAATDATSAVAGYEADADFMAAYRDGGAAAAPPAATRPAPPRTTPAERAKALLLLGDQYAADGQAESARDAYRQVIAHYPTFEAAAEARERLAKMGGGSPP